MVQLLLADERSRTADLSSLTLLSIGSAPLPPNLHQAMAELVPERHGHEQLLDDRGRHRVHLPAAGRADPAARLGRHAAAPDRDPHRRRRGRGAAGRRGGRGADRRGRGPPRVLRRPRGHRPHLVRAVAALGRPRPARRGRLPLHRRPGQGRGDPGRQQHQRRRGRERAVRARRRARGRGRRHPPRRARRGRRRLRGGSHAAATSTPTSSGSSAPSGSPTTRCHGRSGSSTSCRATPTARW